MWIQMANTTIRLANENDAETIHQLMYKAFTPLRELGIDWPSVNANLDLRLRLDILGEV